MDTISNRHTKMDRDRRKIFTLPVIIPAEYQHMRVFIDVHRVSGGG